MKTFLLLAASTLLACGGAQQPTPSVVDAPVEASPDRVVYRWHFEPEPEPAVWLEIEMTGEQDGSTQFGMSTSWGPVAKIQESVNSPTAQTEGTPIPLTEMEIVSVGHVELAVWTLEHEPSAPITFRWKMTNDHEPRRKSTRNFYGPVVRDDVVHAFGRFLVRPLTVEKKEYDIRMEFPGFEKLGWNVVSSFHAEASSFETRMTMDALQAGVFYAGKDLRVSKVEIAEQPVYTAISGAYRASDEELTAMVERVVSLQRDFFDDHESPHFLVSMLPNDAHVNPETPEVADTGTALLHGFAAFLRPTSALDSSATAYGVKNLFAHEMLHHWVSGRIYMVPGPARAAWFHEGFTTYMAGELMRRGEILNAEEFLSHANSFVTAYQKSALRTATNVEAAEAFWKGKDGHEIAYNRGAVLAAFLDREIRAVSKGERRLDHLLREMVVNASANGPLDEVRLMALVRKHTSDEFATWFRERAIDGLAMDLPDDLFGKGFRAVTDSEGIVQYTEAKPK